MEGADRVTPGPTRPPGILHIRKIKQKSKFLLSQAFKWKKIMFLLCFKNNFLITLMAGVCVLCFWARLKGTVP